MSIATILENKLDVRRGEDDCQFNGYLEDFVLDIDELEIDEVVKAALKDISEEDNNAKICVGLKMPVNKEAISNQIIRYKDIFKLQGSPIVIPFIVYSKRDNEEKALIIVPYSKYSYLFAKGLYYCLTEPGSEFAHCKNQIVSISSDSKSAYVDAYKNLFLVTAGSLQRSIDHADYVNYEGLKEDAIACADFLKEEAINLLPTLEDRTKDLCSFVVKWFLLKKVLYVQYMINKDILNKVHEGNVRKQRNQAKLNSEEIKFMSYSELWRCNEADKIKVYDLE